MQPAQKIIREVQLLSNNTCKIIAVSKKKSALDILEAKKMGFSHFGENYIQEMISKLDAFQGCTLHFIGHLQTNKCNDAVEHCDYIHSIDRIKLASAIEKSCIRFNKRIGGFIQINLTNEERKGGESLNKFDELYNHIQKNCPHIQLKGIMYMPPANEDPEPLFLKANSLKQKYNLEELSMGMSKDYLTAIKNGATYVRIGSAIFGQR